MHDRSRGGRRLRPGRRPGAASKKKSGADIKGATDALVTFITTASLRTMPDDVIAIGKRCLIDGFGVILAGSTVQGSAIVRQYVKAITEKKEASVLGAERLMVPAPQAALANGAAGHAMDYDDTQLSTTPDRTFGLLTHPTVPALSAALAVAEQKGVSGADFLEAFLTGFEVECKIAEAIDPNHYQRGFHSSGTIGVFGAAACAAKLLKLEPAAVAHTLTIASGVASGIRVNFGSMSKPLHVGRAAENGVFAAELASRGFTGGAEGLDGKWGFFQVFGGGAELDRLVPVLGKPYAIVNPGVSIKPYPCGSLSHPDHGCDAEARDGSRRQAGADQGDARAGGLEHPRSAPVQDREDGARSEVLSSVPADEHRPPSQGGHPGVHRRVRVERTGPADDAARHLVFDPKIEAMGFDKMRSVVEVDLKDGQTFVQAVERQVSRRAGLAVHAGGASRTLHRLRDARASANPCAAGARANRRCRHVEEHPRADADADRPQPESPSPRMWDTVFMTKG